MILANFENDYLSINVVETTSIRNSQMFPLVFVFVKCLEMFPKYMCVPYVTFFF